MRSTLILLTVMLFISGCSESDKPYFIKDGRFHTNEGPIPDGCIAQLMTELNGDNSVAAIYLNRTSLRGCIAANFPYPGGDPENIHYEIIEETGQDSFNIKVCETLPASRLGEVCDQIIVEFNNRQYLTPEQTIEVLSLEKRGEW